MSFYELTFIIRHDVSLNDIDKVVDDFTKIIKDSNGTVIKKEYWGLRTLAYKIGNNKKGHYYLLGLEIPSTSKDATKELERKMKLNENIIRFLNVKVDFISNEPSPILKNQNTENTPVVDVTVN